MILLIVFFCFNHGAGEQCTLYSGDDCPACYIIEIEINFDFKSDDFEKIKSVLLRWVQSNQHDTILRKGVVI